MVSCKSLPQHNRHSRKRVGNGAAEVVVGKIQEVHGWGCVACRDAASHLQATTWSVMLRKLAVTAGHGDLTVRHRQVHHTTHRVLADFDVLQASEI